MKDFLVEVDEGTKGLILGGGGYIFLYGEMGQKFLDLFFSQLAGMLFIMKEDITSNPIGI